MTVHLRRQWKRGLAELRYDDCPKRIRARLGGIDIVDTTGGLLVWEPGWIVPQYAVRADDLRGELVPDHHREQPTLAPGDPPYDPVSGRRIHTAAGRPLSLRHRGGTALGAAFRLADDMLRDYVVLEFLAFDGWLEEDEEVIGHPHDPYVRIDVRRSARRVRVEHRGQVLAETIRSLALFETHLPTRYYLSRADVVVPLRPSSTTSVCAYKGQASYWSADLGDRSVEDAAWSYEQPLAEVSAIAGLVCFAADRTDLSLDGAPEDRPRSPWSDSD